MSNLEKLYKRIEDINDKMIELKIQKIKIKSDIDRERGKLKKQRIVKIRNLRKKGMTLEEIGETEGVTRQRIQQILDR